MIERAVCVIRQRDTGGGGVQVGLARHACQRRLKQLHRLSGLARGFEQLGQLYDNARLPRRELHGPLEGTPGRGNVAVAHP